MNKDKYVLKTFEFLSSLEIADLKLTNRFQNQIKKSMKDSSIFDKKYNYSLIVMNPQPPKLYSLIKLHKDNEPIRPVVSFVAAP